jgi:hypothetical protein
MSTLDMIVAIVFVVVLMSFLIARFFVVGAPKYGGI